MPRTGRPRRALPRTPTEAAAELRRFGLSPTVLPLGVFLTLSDVVIVLDRLRKRGRAADVDTTTKESS